MQNLGLVNFEIRPTAKPWAFTANSINSEIRVLALARDLCYDNERYDR